MAPRKKTTQTKAPKSNDKVLWSTIFFACGILTLLLTVIEGESLWNSIHNMLLGLFGVSVFLMSPILFYVSIMIALDKTQKTVEGKVIQGLIMIFLVSSLVQIIFVGSIGGGDLTSETIPALYVEGKQLRSGGIFSILIAGPLLALFKRTGATIIIILLTFVFLMLISNKTIIDLFRYFKRLAASANEARGEYKETEDFIPTPGANKKIKEEKKKPVPNADVPQTVAKEKQSKFNVDIPLPNGKKATADPVSENLQQVTENKDEDFPQHPIVSPAVTQDVKQEDAKAKPSSELDDIIKKAAAKPEPKKSIFSGTKETIKEHSKTSTLASNKIITEEELDIPDAPTAADIQHEIIEQKKDVKVYKIPPISLLKESDNSLNAEEAEIEMKNNADTLVDTLKSFGVQTRIVDIHRGPTVTRYELQPSAGVKISKITSLSDDIALNLAAAGVRIEAPIPGKAAVGVEVPNRVKDIVSIREMIESSEFANSKSKLSFVVGKNIDGEVIVGDIAKMPHVIIAGTTGSGKSVCTNSIIMSILYNASPDEVRLVLIDPKMVEFKIYDGIPHLLIPVVTDPRKAAGALSWAVQEMLKRYKLFADNNVRDLKSYNEMAEHTEGVELLPQIVIAIDELADLMMAAANEVEDSICRLAQMARAAGMHLIIATQRPTVDIITGLIKANIPSRIALTVSSQVDSRTIIDTAGAEKLLGYGDMLYYPSGIPKPVRVQGCFCSSKEVEAVVEFIKNDGLAEYSNDIMEEIEKNMPAPKGEKSIDSGNTSADNSDGDIIDRAVEVVIDAGQASTSYLQRKLKLGYARAARIIDELEEMGIVGPFEGAKPRSVLITREMWLQRKLINQNNSQENDGVESLT